VNKLQGFYELRRIRIPSISWREFTPHTTLSPDKLWTIRVAVAQGNDFNLPRAVGLNAADATIKGREFIQAFPPPDLVIYYPYFLALKSGTMSIQEERTVIEAVNRDLWNLTTAGRRDVSMAVQLDSGDMSIFGEETFLEPDEISELLRYDKILRAYNHHQLFGSTTVMVEWSYAMNSDLDRRPTGNKYLVFYEYRLLPG